VCVCVCVGMRACALYTLELLTCGGGGQRERELRNYYRNCQSTYEEFGRESQVGLDTRADRLADRQL